MDDVERSASHVGLRVNSNIDALLSHQRLDLTTRRLAASMQRLSSGIRIDNAKDDAAGLGISERMRSQIRGLDQARRNGQDGVSMLQTIDGALNEVHSILQRARDLCVQFNNDTFDPTQKQTIANELATLSAELGRISSQTQFNGQKLLQSGGAVITLQIGVRANEVITFALATLMGPINALTNPNDFFLLPFFTADLSVLDADIDRVSNARARFGAIQNRLEHTLNQQDLYQEALMSSESRIRDTDMAREMTEYTRQQMLQESGTSMLGIAQRSSQDILRLLSN
jgi:flagellin